MITKSSIKLSVVGFDPPPAASGYGQGITATSPALNVSLEDGSLDNQVKRIIALDSSVTAGGSATIDLQSNDRYGVADASTDVVMMYIVNNGPGEIALRPSASNPWSSFIRALPGGTDTPEIRIYPGMGLLLHALGAGVLPVAGADKEVDLVEVGGVSAAAINIQIWTR